MCYQGKKLKEKGILIRDFIRITIGTDSMGKCLIQVLDAAF